MSNMKSNSVKIPIALVLENFAVFPVEFHVAGFPDWTVKPRS